MNNLIPPEYYSNRVRVCFVKDAGPYDDNVIVEQFVNGEWRRYLGYNSLSNDSAHYEAKRTATRLSTRHREQHGRC